MLNAKHIGSSIDIDELADHGKIKLSKPKFFIIKPLNWTYNKYTNEYIARTPFDDSYVVYYSLLKRWEVGCIAGTSIECNRKDTAKDAMNKAEKHWQHLLMRTLTQVRI